MAYCAYNGVNHLYYRADNLVDLVKLFTKFHIDGKTGKTVVKVAGYAACPGTRYNMKEWTVGEVEIDLVKLVLRDIKRGDYKITLYKQL